MTFFGRQAEVALLNLMFLHLSLMLILNGK